MSRRNPCVTGDTKVWTVNGVKSFKELADADKDVNVYCIDADGNVKVSRMFHPRLTGRVATARIVLENGTVLNATSNHMFLTKDGYVAVEDLMEGDRIASLKNDYAVTASGIEEDIKRFTEYTGTKKGTVIKTCEVSGEEFECTWDEREQCAKAEYEADLYEIKGINYIPPTYYDFLTVQTIEFSEERTDVYNGTVAVYHNYFTIDENTDAAINQLNCGE